MGRTPHIPLGGEPAKADHEAVAAALDQVGIEALAERRYDELSGGERQLALIARAVAQDTPIILLDEPTASLDLANQAMALRVIQGLARRGRAILMTTHLPEQAFLLDADVMLLKTGSASRVGPVFDLCTRERLEDLYGTPLTLLGDPAEAGVACVVRL
jgi:iron complex transport system ATP-binding protein